MLTAPFPNFKHNQLPPRRDPIGNLLSIAVMQAQSIKKGRRFDYIACYLTYLKRNNFFPTLLLLSMLTNFNLKFSLSVNKRRTNLTLNNAYKEAKLGFSIYTRKLYAKQFHTDFFINSLFEMFHFICNIKKHLTKFIYFNYFNLRTVTIRRSAKRQRKFKYNKLIRPNYGTKGETVWD